MKNAARLLLYLVVLFLPAYYWRFSLAGIPTNIIEIVVLGCFILALPSLKLRSLLKEKWLVIASGLILAGLLIGVVIAPDRTASLGIVKSYFVVPMLFFASFHSIIEKKNLPTINILVGLNLLFVGGYALLVWSGATAPLVNKSFDIASYLSQHRAVGFFESPNYLAMYLVPLWLWFISGAKLPFWRSAISAIVVVAIFASVSRAGLLALLAGLIVLVNLRPDVGKIVKRISLGLGAVALVSAIWLERATDSIRIDIWSSALKILHGHWLLGIGPGQFQHYFALQSQGQPWFTDSIATVAYHPHNIFLAFWLGTGLIGLAGFGLLLWFLVKKTLELKNGLLVLPALTAIVAHGMFDTTYFKNDLSIVFWMLVSLALLKNVQENPQ